jgi:hypothetical protein
MRMHLARWGQAALLASLALGPISCGCTGDEFGGGGTPIPVVTPMVVTAIQPPAFIGYRPMPFTLTGSGFLRGAAPKPTPPPGTAAAPSAGGSTAATTVLVTFVDTADLSFRDGTSAEEQVLGTVLSDTEIQGISPTTDASGGWVGFVRVTDALGSSTSTQPIAKFVGLTVFTIDKQVIRSDQETRFEVTGLAFLSVGGKATVRFSSLPRVFPADSDFFDVIVDVIRPDKVAGKTPTFSLTTEVPTFVSVILHEEPGSPQASSHAALTVFTPPPPIPVVVTAISPAMPIDVSTPFRVTGSGFLGAGGDPDVQVTFTTTPETPFRRATASTVTVAGTALDDFTVVGMSPIGTALNDFTAFVTVTRTDGMEGTSATDIALFTVPLPRVTEFAPDVMPSDVVTPFTIIGTNLPAGETATVRFRAVAGTPFAGPSASADVVANVTTVNQIDGLSPLSVTTEPFLCEVDVILLGGTELNMGEQCTFVPPDDPPPPGGCIVTNLGDAGPGSLRDQILNAPPGCVITFDPALSGDLDVDSTLFVPHDVQILGPGPDVIRVGARRNDYPVFTIQAGSPNTVIALLGIQDSHHEADGGGFLVHGGLTLVRCELRDHEIEGHGGAVYVAAGGTLALRECTLSGNVADGRGGAVFVDENATALITGCTFDGNEAGSGGGALGLSPAATLDLVNCTLDGNETSGGPGGGAILVGSNSRVTLIHCTLTENVTQGKGGGVMIQNGILIATNCIFSRNSDGRGQGPEIFNQSGLNNTTFSLVRVGAGSDLFNGINGNRVGTENDPLDAKLASLAENGGPTRTMMPKQGSPVVGVASGAACTSTDQRGVARPIGAGCDMGACEADLVL